MITFEPLDSYLKEHGISKYRLIEDGVITRTEITRMRKHHNFSFQYLDRLCVALNCQPQDIIKYLPNDDPAVEPNEANILRKYK